MMKLLNEFKAFMLRGNVVDMAVGIIIGAAFSTIVGSLVKDVIMPPIAAVSGDQDFSDKSIELKKERPNPNYVKGTPDVPKTIPNKDWKAGDSEDQKELPNPAYVAPSGPEVKPTLPPLHWRYGAFLQAIISFLIIGLCMFFLIKGMNTLMRKKKEEPKPAELTTSEKLLTEIRDAVKTKS
jgi:large conductance mechanosensitive channel